jgi:hypothetical protein
MREAEEETSALNHALRVGAQLLLNPFNVMHCAAYWVPEYSGGVGLAEDDHFVSLVRNLLRHPARLQLVYSQGVTRHAHALLSQHGLLRLCGNASHALPQERMAEGQMHTALASLAWLERPERKCFLSVTTDGLDGELQLASFVYDQELQALYEPSFHILSLYAIHLPALYHTTAQQCDEDWVPRHLHSLRPLADAALDAEGALDACDTLEKRARCRRDLVTLREALETTSFEQAMESLQALWSEKASWCDARIDELL